MRTGLVIIAAGLLSLAGTAANADSLREVLTSDSMDSVIKQTKNNNYKIKKHKLDQHRWINPKSTFGKLFTKNKQALSMINWLASETGDYKIRKAVGLKGKEYAYAEARLKKKERPLVFLHVLVPHPKYVEMMLFNLLPDFNELTPPKARLALEQPVEINGHKAVLYKMKNGHCSLVIESARYSRIQLAQKECPRLNDLMDVAKLLDLVRFKRKLGDEPARLQKLRDEMFYGEKKKPVADLPPAETPKPTPPPPEFIYN